MRTSNPDINATQLNLHENPPGFSASAGENVAVEQRLEEGTCSRESLLASVGPARAIALICVTPLLTAALRELHVCQHALDNLKRGIDRSAKESLKHASLCMAGESPYILRYLCRRLEQPLQEILRDCRLITAEAREANSSHEPDLTQVSAEVAGRTINRISEYMLPVIADANRLARIADGRDERVLTSMNLSVFLEELSTQLR
ncbi:hypothetical protein HDU86_003276, partial [Geranomyces michiganensis]